MTDNVSHTDEDPLVSLAAIAELENLYSPPTIMCMNDPIESPPLETAPLSSTHISTEVFDVSSRIEEFGLGSNKFASLVTSDGEGEEQLDPVDSADLLTPFGKRLLRERPVKLSVNAKEIQLQTTSRNAETEGVETGEDPGRSDQFFLANPRELLLIYGSME